MLNFLRVRKTEAEIVTFGDVVKDSSSPDKKKVLSFQSTFPTILSQVIGSFSNYPNLSPLRFLLLDSVCAPMSVRQRKHDLNPRYALCEKCVGWRVTLQGIA